MSMAAPHAVRREDKLLSSRRARVIVARLDAATDESYPERATHIRQVALTVMRAKGIR